VPPDAESTSTDEWTAVIARALAFLCLERADLRDKGLVPQAEFLERIGLSRKEAARLLGTSDRSLTELFRQQRTRNGATKRGARKTKSTRRG
jgi:hypothetical protein